MCKDALRLLGGWRTHRKFWQFSRLPQLVFAGRLLESLLSGMPGELTHTHTHTLHISVCIETHTYLYITYLSVLVSLYVTYSLQGVRVIYL